jgi:hypothetical protein
MCQKIQRRLEEVLSLIPWPVSGCWFLHGAETVFYDDRSCECHVLEVWPMGVEGPDEQQGNDHEPAGRHDTTATKP